MTFNWGDYQNSKHPLQCAFNDMMKNVPSDQPFWMQVSGINDISLAKQLIKICDNMSATYDEAVADENIYEIQDAQRTVEQIKQEMIEKQQRLSELREKQENGTITEDEREELKTISNDVNYLKTELIAAIKSETFAIHNFEEKDEEQKSVRETALNYSEAAIDDGEDLIESYTQKAQRFFSRLFNITYDDEIDVGKEAVTSGINLENVVKTSDAMLEIANVAASSATKAANEAEKIAESAETAPAQDLDKKQKK